MTVSLKAATERTPHFISRTLGDRLAHGPLRICRVGNIGSPWFGAIPTYAKLLKKIVNAVKCAAALNLAQTGRPLAPDNDQMIRCNINDILLDTEIGSFQTGSESTFSNGDE